MTRTSWLLVPALALGATTAWWFARGPEGVSTARKDDVTAAARANRPASPRDAEVLRLIRERGPVARQKLVELYGSLAADPSATATRALTLNALFSETSLPLRLKNVLDAVAADPTPPGQDALWPEITKRLSEQWTPDVFDKGRDLMLMEKRPRARRALIESFTELATSKHGASISAEQSSALLTDLIDVHALVDPDQKLQIQEAVRELGGNDPAELLAGRGLTSGNKLELQAEYERQLQAAMKTLVKDPPN